MFFRKCTAAIPEVVGALVLTLVIAVCWPSKGVTNVEQVSIQDKWHTEMPSPFRNSFETWERHYRLPLGLLSSVAYTESRYKTNAISSAGAIGIMQIIPKYHPEVDPENPFDSIEYSARYLRKLKDEFGSWHWALAAYNYGETRIRKVYKRGRFEKDVPRSVQKYVRETIERTL